MSYELPRGWEWCTVDKIARYVTSGSRDWSKFYSKDGYAYFVRSAEINDYSFRLSEAIRVNLPAAVEGKRTLIEPGDILVTITGANVGKCAKVDGRIPEAYVSQSVALIKVADIELTPFVYFALRAPNIGGKQLSERAYGVGRPVLSLPQIRSIQVPLAPIAEQHRIVAAVQQTVGKIDACQKRLAKTFVLLRRFRRSVLAAACSGRLTADWREPTAEVSERGVRDPDLGLPEIPDSWRWVKLSETGKMSRGKSRHRPRDEPSLYGGPYPFIQTGDIARSGGRITSHKQTYSKAGLAQSRLWPERTICITIAANIAESAILTYPACFPDSVVGIIANPSTCVAQYVEFFIRVAKANLAKYAPATAQKNINIAILNEVSVPLPPLDEQREIVGRVKALLGLANRIEERLKHVSTQVDQLTPSLLTKAFTGELVPPAAELASQEGREYESASELLQRIKRERAQSLDEAGDRRKARSKADGSGGLRRKAG
jgi:type I restriction enzyme S subunit